MTVTPICHWTNRIDDKDYNNELDNKDTIKVDVIFHITFE